MKTRTCVRTTPAALPWALALAVALAMICAWTAAGWASTAANLQIQNDVTVTYSDSAGSANYSQNASAVVTVELVPAAPTLSQPADQTINAGDTATYTYTITSNANGPDTYNLTVPVVTPTNVSGASATLSVASVTLGATTAAATVTINAGSNTVITVPADGANDGSVNGIAVNDTVVIGGFAFTVTAVDDSNGGTPNSTSTITVSPNGNTPSLAVGDNIGEQASFTLDVTGTLTDPTVNGTVAATTTATSQTDGTATASDDTLTTIQAINLTVTKYVRNVTHPVAGGGSTVTVGGNTYYTTGVTGAPGDTLEYLIAVANGAGSPATNVVIQDAVPAFTSYVAGSMQLDPGTGSFSSLNDNANGGDAGEYDSGNGTVWIYAGSGGDDGGAGYGDGNGGSLAAGTTTYGLFQVTINN